MLFSFIIPLYNCEDYISHCLDCILSSQLPEDGYEIIIINDESKDNGPRICQEYAEQHQQIHIYHQKNDGPATARNLGLQHAQGDFIWFIDADDLIEPKIIQQVLQVIQECPNVELLSFAYIEQYPDKEITHCLVNTQTVCNGLEFLKEKGGGYLWNNIYRRQSIGNKRFVNSVRHIEDFCFNHQTIIDFEKVVVLPDIGYRYNRKNVSSISHGRSQIDRDKANDDSYRVYQTLYEDMRQCDDVAKRMFLEKVLHFSIAAHLYTMMQFDDRRTIKGYISAYREMGLYPLKPTGNRKSDAFIRIANHEWLFLYMLRIARLFRNNVDL